MCSEYAYSVAHYSPSINTAQTPIVRARVRRVTSLVTRHRVFNLTIEGEHEFFADGVLVHNCWRYPDAWAQFLFGLRLGKAPRAIVTTTPRPTKLIKDLAARQTTVLTRGSTFENKGNLAAQFIDEVLSQFEGTRLARQEIDGEILDDNPGALWKLSQLDAGRVMPAANPNHPHRRVMPQLRRVVVGVDPAVSSNEDSDETGIVVAGLGVDGHLYVLDDLSGIYTPHEWGMLVFRAAHKPYQGLPAECIVAEVNQGGDLVESNIRAVTRSTRIRKVHACRGKALRAEPISALYEQNRVHHVGTLAKLEDQMVNWNPSVDGKSPDRVDALVYALTELSGITKEGGARR